MSLLRNKWLWLSVLGILLSGGVLIVLVGYLALVVYTGLVTGGPLVSALLGAAIPVILGGSLSVALLAVSLVGLLYVVVQNASFPRSQRIATVAANLEKEYSPIGTVGLADFLAPPEPSADEKAEQALADLKQHYVDGDITEAEFEERVDRLVSNESIDEARADRERRRVVDRER